MMDFEGKKYQWGGTGVNFVPTLQVDENSISSIGISRTIQSEVAIGSDAYSVGCTIASTIEIANASKYGGYGVIINGASVITDELTVFAGKNIKLHIYTEAPTNTPTDNSQFAIQYADAGKWVGSINIQLGTGNLATVGTNYSTIIRLNPTTTSLYVVIENVDGTIAVAEKSMTILLSITQGS